MQLEKLLQDLKQNSNFRTLNPLKHEGNFVFKNGKKLLNLAGNDYLNLAASKNLKTEFLNTLDSKNLYFSSSSSRSLSGNFEIYEEFEDYLRDKFTQKEVLHFNNGYALNSSCIAALAELGKVLFLADKLIHASMIDGLRLSKAHFFRFKHNDTKALERLLEKHHKEYEYIIILSEALFSMDGDFADIRTLNELKKRYENVLLYIDEAHSVGCFEKEGLGYVKSLGIEVDFLVFTFGKALSSMGACMICKKEFKDFFINKARALIYSTALAPLNVAWSLFIFKKLKEFEQKRQDLAKISAFFLKALKQKDCELLGQAHIISLILTQNQKAIEFAQKLEQNGFFAPAIKEPTVPKNTARIRFSLHSGLKENDLKKILELL